jgi:uncharacterized repeat protein (TIGR01451 family)
MACCRTLTPDDFEAENVTFTVSKASATPYSTTPTAIFSDADSLTVGLSDRSAILDLAFSATPLQLNNAGETVTFTLTATNTGTLRLRSVTLSVPEELNGTLSCTTQGSSSGPGAAVLEPGPGIVCDASLSVTTARIEGGPKQFSVSAAASSVLGVMQPVTKSVQLEPVVRPQLTVTVDEAACTKPTKAGE